MAQNNLFVPVENETQKRELIDALGAGLGVVSLEAFGHEQSVQVARLEPNGEVLVHLPEGATWPFPAEARVSARFYIEGRPYMLACVPRVVAGGAYLPTEGEQLFRSQPRKQFRMVVPEKYDAFFEIESVGPRPVSAHARVIDVSPDGLGLRIPAEVNPRVGDQISGKLRLGKRPALPVAGTVRHTRGQDLWQVGLELEHTVHQTEDRLNEALLFLRHDLFYLDKDS